jgi:hypothetical protein
MHVEDLDQSNIEVVKKNLENLERGIFALEMDVMHMTEISEH